MKVDSRPGRRCQAYPEQFRGGASRDGFRIIPGPPERGLRTGGLIAGLAAIGLPVVLEWLGVIPSSYLFPGDGFSVIPQMTALPTWFVLSFLGIANLLIAVLPALFVARLRGTLSVMQERELVRSWHLRRLGDDLMKAAA